MVQTDTTSLDPWLVKELIFTSRFQELATSQLGLLRFERKTLKVNTQVTPRIDGDKIKVKVSEFRDDDECAEHDKRDGI